MTSCPTVHKSHPHKLWCIHYKSVWLHLESYSHNISQNTTYRDIYVGVTCGQLDMRSFFIPTLVPIFFSQVSHPLIFWKKIFFNLMCLFVYLFDGLWPLEMVRVCHYLHQHSFLHLCSFVCLVFHFKHTPRSREESWKATVWSTQCLSLSHSIRRLGATLSMLKLNL